MQCTFAGGRGGGWGWRVQVRAGATGAGQVHLRNAAWCERVNNAKRSFRRAGAAQEGSHVGFVVVDGQFEGSFAVTAGQRVRLRAQQRTRARRAHSPHLLLAATSDLAWTRSFVTSALPPTADKCRGVHPYLQWQA